MSEIKEIKMFVCPETGNTFKTKKQAENSAQRFLRAKEESIRKQQLAKESEEEKAKKANYIRFNLSNVSDLASMITEKAKEFYGVTVKDLNIGVSFCKNMGTSHHQPLDKSNKEYTQIGWAGTISGIVIGPSLGFMGSATDLLFTKYDDNIRFNGFYTGTGCPGSHKGEYPISISFEFFLCDFPLLQEKYNKYLEIRDKCLKNYSVLSSLKIKAYDHSRNHSSVIDITNQIAELEKKKNELISKLYKEYKEANPVTLLDIGDDLKDLNKNFREYNDDYWLPSNYKNL